MQTQIPNIQVEIESSRREIQVNYNWKAAGINVVMNTGKQIQNE